MPYKSRAQAAYMHIHHPEIASEMDAKHREAYPEGKHLPKHVKGSKYARKRKRKRKVSKSMDLVEISKTLPSKLRGMTRYPYLRFGQRGV